ncbi:VTT domain-containing protein [Cytobacillus suaedae]|nr:VTT domain-containing protein [Cytobacillus suaedae]
MTEMILGLIEEWGIWGILLSMFIEGSALPFFGTFLIITVGFIMDLSWFELAWISLVGSLVYAIGSYIPYYIGLKFGKSVEKRLSQDKREKLEKAKVSFTKHGIWSVALSSPLHLGNVIPFLAGMSNMKLSIYTLLTIAGIAPSTFILLSIGRFYQGDIDTVIAFVTEYQSRLLLVFLLLTIAYIVWKIYGEKRRKKTENYSVG